MRHRTTGPVSPRPRHWGSLPRRARERGFTLIELMVVVIIMGTIALATVPGIGVWRADSRTREGAYEVLKLARGARYQAMREGVAFALRYQAAGSNGLGTIDVYRGMTNHCRQANWIEAVDTHGPVTTLDMARFNPGPGTPTETDTGRHVVQTEWWLAGFATALPNAVLCYEPAGRVFITDETFNTATFAPANLAQQRRDITVRVTGTRNGATESVARNVFFPAGGQPRMLYQ